MQWKLTVGGVAFAAGLAVLAVACTGMKSAEFEVWVTDQSGSAGTLYIYKGNDLTDKAEEAVPEVIDLAGAVSTLCQQQTGSAPTRAHMLMFNDSDSHAVISYVATGHVVFLEAPSRAPLSCIDVGEQAHASMPAPDESYVLVADQNGKKLHRIETDYNTQTFSHDDAATLDLAGCTTPNGAPCQEATLRPDNAPICLTIDSSSRLAFVTLRGGGMFVVDATTSPISIVAEYDNATVHGNGLCGVEKNEKMFINAGGATKANPRASALYSFPQNGFPATGFNPPNTPPPTLIFSREVGDHDSHAMLFTGGHAKREGFVWAGDRFANEIEVVDPETEKLVNTFTLAGEGSPDPAPDIMDIAPGGDYAFVVLRGPCPLTANVEGVNNAVGATPGVGVVKVQEAGRKGKLVGIAAITSAAPAGFDCATRADDAAGSITNQADPHGLMVRLTKE